MTVDQARFCTLPTLSVSEQSNSKTFQLYTYSSKQVRVEDELFWSN
jgi:hypothetical protein